MLVRLIITNFLSFKEETEFNMLSSLDQKHHKKHIYKENTLDLLKTAIMYGANGAGKSNFIKAIALLKDIVGTGGKQALQKVKRFKLEESYLNMPTTFEVEFIKNGTVYLFGIVFTEEIIIEEWIYQSGLNNKEDKILYHRKHEDNKIKIEFSSLYTKTKEDQFTINFVQNNLIDDNTLTLKVLADLKEGFKEIKEVYEWFTDDLIIVFPNTRPHGLVSQLITSPSFKKFASKTLCSFHTGISSIGISTTTMDEHFSKNDFQMREFPLFDKIKKDLFEKKTSTVGMRGIMPNNLGGIPNYEEILILIENEEPVVKRFKGMHINRFGNEVEFFLNEESDGTNRLLELIPALYKFLNSASVVFIDEINESIHPVLLKELVRKVVNDEKSKGQLIFSTHEANLLDQEVFRRDEIWFAEKQNGETKLYPLSDYDIRFDLDLKKGYLNGRFGAIPFIGNLKDLNWEENAETEPCI